MQFFNTAIILFLISIDYSTLTIKIDWYATHAGSVVSAMIFTAFWPLIELVMFGSALKMLRHYDRNYTNNKF